MLPLLFAATLFLLLAALAAFWLARRGRARAGLPFRARIVYADTGAWQRVEKPLYSQEWGLSGRPDYIARIGRDLIPVEVKPNRDTSTPRLPDVLQLAAYGVLLQADKGVRPPYGLLKYRERVFQIEFTKELTAQLWDILGEMRAGLRAKDVDRSHQEPRRCRACGYRDRCGQELETSPH